MKYFVLLTLLPLTSLASSPTPFPIFLKAGFSTILEFEDVPTRVVLGDSSYFQLERLEKSLVIKTLSPYATTNMFVYFKTKETRLFVVTASEDAEPTYYKKFETPVLVPKPAVIQKGTQSYKRSTRLLKSEFDSKKDYLTVEIAIMADSKEPIRPSWDRVRLVYKGTPIAPYKLWAERKDVQKDSQVKSRFIFAKPNVPRTLKDVTLVIPIDGNSNPIRLNFPVRAR